MIRCDINVALEEIIASLRSCDKQENIHTFNSHSSSKWMLWFNNCWYPGGVLKLLDNYYNKHIFQKGHNKSCSQQLRVSHRSLDDGESAAGCCASKGPSSNAISAPWQLVWAEQPSAKLIATQEVNNSLYKNGNTELISINEDTPNIMFVRTF